jgi:hypothetical protein
VRCRTTESISCRYGDGQFFFTASPALVAAGFTSLDQLSDAATLFPSLDRTVYGPSLDSGLGLIAQQVVAGANAAPGNAGDPAGAFVCVHVYCRRVVVAVALLF